jgi:hypothetical protein
MDDRGKTRRKKWRENSEDQEPSPQPSPSRLGEGGRALERELAVWSWEGGCDPVRDRESDDGAEEDIGGVVGAADHSGVAAPECEGDEEDAEFGEEECEDAASSEGDGGVA